MDAKDAMDEIALSMEHLYKKFRKGQSHDSLRDLLPALARGLFSRGPAPDLQGSEFWALKDVSFQVKRGEAFGVMGHNGAGKSTLLKHLCGILKPTKGSLKVNGRLSALIEVSAGFHPDLTGRENVFLNGCILGMTKAEIRRKFDEIVEFSGLESFIDTPVKRYSSGMYTRLGFSVAAHLEPDILVIDEVLSVGDYLFQRKGVEKINSIMKAGATVIFVSHNLRAMAGLCQNSILMEHGQVLHAGPTNQVVKYYLEHNAKSDARPEGKDAVISRVQVHGQAGDDVRFEAGTRATVDVEVTGNRDLEKLSVVLELHDEDMFLVFETSSEHLSDKSFSLSQGKVWNVSFDLKLHLAPGTYHLSVWVYRHDIQKSYDHVFPAATLYITSEREVRGVANLYPEILRMDPC